MLGGNRCDRGYLVGLIACVQQAKTLECARSICFYSLQMPKLLLIDGSNYLFRAYHALPPLTTSKGEATGAIKGFDLMLNNVEKQVKPDFAACIFDAPGKNFRHKIYPDYKANRPPMPEDLRSQIEPIFELVKLKGWPLIQVDGVEADDVLATLAVRAQKLGWNIVIATGDKDLAQMVDDHISLINTMTHTELDSDGVLKKYGVAPDRIIDYLALMGDKVDNVPGINKCGPKTAAKWIAQYGSLQGIVEHAGEVKGKIGEYLRAGLPFLDTARKLVTIDKDAPVGLTPQELVRREPDTQKLAAFYARWEMSGTRPARRSAPSGVAGAKSIAAPDLFSGAISSSVMPTDTAVAAQSASDSPCSFTVIDNALQLAALAKELEDYEGILPVAVSLLTDRISPLHDLPSGVAFAVTPLRLFYVPLDNVDGSCIKASSFKECLAKWFAGPSAKVFHDAKYCRHVFANLGIELGGEIHDSMLMDYVLEAHLKHDLPRLAVRFLLQSVPSEEDFLGKGASKVTANTRSVLQTGTYLTAQAAALRAVSAVMIAKLAEDEKLTHIYRNIELPVCRVLWQMERTGVDIDADLLRRQSTELAEELSQLEANIMKIAGETFNPASPKQLAQVLFTKLGLPVKKKTASGTPSTDEEVLSELALDYPLPRLILQYRGIAKLKGTYTDKLPLMEDPVDHRVHTTFGQATAVTGRLASSDPNLQNIPARTPEGKRIRDAFIAPEGCQILSADYSQIELRIMAHISGDPGLLKAFHEGLDIHKATASKVFGVDMDKVTPEERRMAKVINFGLIYGMSAFGLAQQLGVDRKAASAYIEEYFGRFPLVRRYMEETRIKAREHGYVETAFGRRLWLPDIRSPRAQARAGAERAAINAPMQGTAADLIKMAMVAVDSWLKQQNAKSRMVLQVHDELILEVPQPEIALMKEKIPALMAGVAQLRVPLLASVGVAPNWGDAH